MSVSIYVQNASGNENVPADRDFRDWIGAVFAERRRGEVGVRIVGEHEARSLNRRYRSRDYATNVLAFPGDDDLQAAGAEAPLGDIVICAAVVEREAREQRSALRAYWAHMVIHGALHLDGYDHETDEQARKMEAREALLLAWFGFPNPWESLAQDSPPLHHNP
ncbi:MAG: rRNA maturation RNase YbeY [Gammaproteobacteria bacterium]|jgi:probable rRNA maturation factor